MHFTYEEERTAGEMLAAMLGISGIPLSRKWRARRSDHRAQRIYEDGLPEVAGVREAVPPSRERTAVLERDMKFVRQTLTELSENQTEMKTMIVALDKKITGNGGNTYDSGDVLQRVAKALGVWEVGSEDEQNRRKDDGK